MHLSGTRLGCGQGLLGCRQAGKEWGEPAGQERGFSLATGLPAQLLALPALNFGGKDLHCSRQAKRGQSTSSWAGSAPILAGPPVAMGKGLCTAANRQTQGICSRGVSVGLSKQTGPGGRRRGSKLQQAGAQQVVGQEAAPKMPVKAQQREDFCAGPGRAGAGRQGRNV